MRKKLLAIVLAVVMLIGIVPTTFVGASTSTATVTVKADKTSVNPGDEISFSVELQQTGKINTLEVYIDLPTGLTYVADSLTTINKSTLGWDDFSEINGILGFSGYGSESYEGTAPVEVATFKATVDSNASGTLSVGFEDLVADDENYETKNPTGVPAAITVVVPVTGVALDRDTLSLDTGSNNTATLVATVAPGTATNKTVTWDSSDKTVATVNNGVVTALKEGTTTITVKTAEGNFTDTCVVTVTCAHVNKTLTEEKIANCQEGGNAAYYTCDGCGQLLAADGTTKIDAIPTTPVDANNHKSLNNYPANTATCVTPGNNAYTKCDACGVVTAGSDNKFYGEHNFGTLIPAVSEKHTATELSPAVAAHYQCSVCQKYFTESKVETTLEALTGTTPTHSYGNWITTDADQHWKECGCGHKTLVAAHDYDNTCDTTCNTCGHVRTITHTWSTSWLGDGVNHWHECSVCHVAKNDEGAHTGGTATCEAKKVCTVCNLPYGDYAPCDYVDVVDAKYLVSEATCVAKAVYKKSCSVCGKAHATETFENGTVNANKHTGGTYLDGKVGSTCINPGYTGDTKCNSCHAVITYGTTAPLAEHKPATSWSKDATNHWKVCQTSGCTHKIELNAHDYDNTCDTTCNTCGYVRTITHTWDTKWSDDGAKHWHDCTVCHNAKNDEGTHTGGTATCKDKKVCTVCNLTYGDYAACNFVEKIAEDYLVSAANCGSKAVYKKSCSVCGKAHATETFTTGTIDANNHVGETEIKDYKAEKCDEPGFTGDTWCKTCNKKIKDGNVIPAGHKTTEVKANSATHEAAGNIAYYTCSGCSLLFKTEEAKAEDVIEKLEDTVIPKVEHSYGEKYESDADNHWKKCECGNEAEKAAHTYGDWKVTKESTTTVKGTKEKTCSVCGNKVTEELPLAQKPATNTNPDVPKTGISGFIFVWAFLMVVSAAGIVSFTFVKEKRVK